MDRESTQYVDNIKPMMLNTVDRKANASPSAMDSTKRGTVTGQDSATNRQSQCTNSKQSFFKKNFLALDRTSEHNPKTRQSKHATRNYNGDMDRFEGRHDSKDFEIKFTNKARPRCLPVKSSIFHSNKELGSNIKEFKTPEIQILDHQDGANQITIEMPRKSQMNMKGRTILKNSIRSRPKSVRDCLENRFEEKNNLMVTPPHADQGQSRNEKERIREKSVPKLTISFNNRRVSVETSRGRESSQKTFLKSIEKEITRYTVKKSQVNSEKSVDCFSNGGLRKPKQEKVTQKNLHLPLFPRKLKHTNSARHRSPDQLSIRSKGSMHSKHFDP